jgi:hypothetical protein
MATRKYHEVEVARIQLPHLIVATKPLDTNSSAGRKQSILPLAGSGRGLWGATSAKTMQRLRRELNR